MESKKINSNSSQIVVRNVHNNIDIDNCFNDYDPEIGPGEDDDDDDDDFKQ